MSNFIPIFMRRHVVGCLMVFLVSCQYKVLPLPTESKPEIGSFSSLFLDLKARKSSIKDLKALVRTKVSGEGVNQSFRQTLLVKGNEAMRVDTYNLFNQVLGVLIYEGKKTLMYDPRENRLIYGKEVLENMRRVLGTYIDFGDYISLFLGGIPDLAHLRMKAAKWSNDNTVVQIETTNQLTGGRVDITIDAYTQLPKSLILTRGGREIYRVYWYDYKKIDKFEFAHKIEIMINFKKQSFMVRYSEVMINQGIPSDVFDLEPELIN